MKNLIDYLLGTFYIALAGLLWYLTERYMPKRPQRSTPPANPAPAQHQPGKQKVAMWKRRLAEALAVVVILGAIYGIPEYFGRKDAAGFCAAVPLGERFTTDQDALYAYRNRMREQFDSLFAANYYPKTKGVADGDGAVVVVFTAGFPFSRAYCVLHLEDSVVRSRQVMFNAEDYEYCDGKMRGVWECQE